MGALGTVAAFAQANERPIGLRELLGKTIRAEWVKHRRWVRGNSPIEDDLLNVLDVKLSPDGSFLGTYHQSVAQSRWSQTFEVSGDVNKGAFRATAGGTTMEGVVTYSSGKFTVVRPFGRALSRIEVFVTREGSGFRCSITDAFMKQKGADVEFEFNGAIERHNGREPITRAACQIS